MGCLRGAKVLLYFKMQKESAFFFFFSFGGRCRVAFRGRAGILPFAGEEKITYFPEPISLENAPRGMVAKAGKMFIYAPWKNWGIFYKDHGSTPDNSLIEMGNVESGLEYLANQHGKFVAYIEVCK